MIREPSRLAEGTYDVLIVGGGIYGLTIAYDAALRGLRAALVERRDFGSGSSFNHHKTLHGGLRYLQSLDLGRMRMSIAERRAIARIAPTLVSPLAFVMPTGSSVTRSPLALSLAFLADRAIGAHRNDGLPPSHRLPAGRVVSHDELRTLIPEGRFPSSSRGALWYDYRIDEGDRLSMAFAHAAVRQGARLVNYVSAVEPIRENGRIAGMYVRDEVTGERLRVRASAVVNAAGANAGRLMASFGTRRAFPVLKAMNLVTSRHWTDVAVAMPGPSGRMLVALPWRGRLLIGTAHGYELSGPDDTSVDANEVELFIAEANAAFPWMELRLDDVTLVHRGVVPARHRPGHTPELLDEPILRDHAKDGAPGAISVVGVKYTTARGVAARAVDMVCRVLQCPIRASETDRRPLLEPVADAAGIASSIPESANRIAALYGAAAASIAAIVHEQPALGSPIAAATPVTGAELIHAVRAESALTLEDVVVRRTGLGAAGHPGPEIAARAAQILGAELGWTRERIASELEGLQEFYAIRTTPPPTRSAERGERN